jgi:hypothetical protein
VLGGGVLGRVEEGLTVERGSQALKGALSPLIAEIGTVPPESRRYTALLRHYWERWEKLEWALEDFERAWEERISRLAVPSIEPPALSTLLLAGGNLIEAWSLFPIACEFLKQNNKRNWDVYNRCVLTKREERETERKAGEAQYGRQASVSRWIHDAVKYIDGFILPVQKVNIVLWTKAWAPARMEVLGAIQEIRGAVTVKKNVKNSNSQTKHWNSAGGR